MLDFLVYCSFVVIFRFFIFNFIDVFIYIYNNVKIGIFEIVCWVF